MFRTTESHWPRNRNGERYVLNHRGEESVLLETSARGDGKAFIDWLTVTFPDVAIHPKNGWKCLVPVVDEDFAVALAKRLEEIVGFGIFEKRKSRHKFYEHSWSLGADGRLGFIGVGGQNGTILFELTGEGCMHAKPGWEADMYDFLASGDLKLPKITRVDLTHDDHAGDYNVDRAFDDWFADRFKLPKAPQSPAMAQFGNWAKPDGRGRTVAIGRRLSGKYLRVYEKGRQLGDPKSPWTRIELELKAEDRVIPFDVLTRPGAYLAAAYPALEFLNTEQARIATVRHTVKQGWLSMLKYIRHAAGPALAVALAVIGTQGIEDLVADVTQDDIHRQMVKRGMDLPLHLVAELAESDHDLTGHKGNDDVDSV
ncbi:replication initiation factor domain-containing protein [Methyloversatilis sp.]|uniref:replication initiation factor domain-containing protein n=1 Tax=Methyloversatilis sp. TaxID=2569862 RepID=UPI002733D697|nr:replication initiation factor domain-containing protein [Methyloversatilis sp.]MDP2867807.1 replication initiation factor domain-containing protein [Methyloversatilis sp.]MDP3455067.1 replication initiation factor domain-containing protein [Methyloversatilis sp.]MDP3577288.1 replication initiation factor domain-containing protein [Methyloversatilis sp.]